MVGKRAEEAADADVLQEMEVVDEEIARRRACQRMAEIICKQAAAGGVGRAGVIPEKVKARVEKRVLDAAPENGEMVGVNADTNDG